MLEANVEMWVIRMLRVVTSLCYSISAWISHLSQKKVAFCECRRNWSNERKVIRIPEMNWMRSNHLVSMCRRILEHQILWCTKGMKCNKKTWCTTYLNVRATMWACLTRPFGVEKTNSSVIVLSIPAISDAAEQGVLVKKQDLRKLSAVRRQNWTGWVVRAPNFYGPMKKQLLGAKKREEKKLIKQ